jgi:uncharacterized protein YbjT (DUF2867 family)
MHTTHASDTVLVVGGTGKTGRRVAERLTDRGVPVRIGSRSGTPAFSWDDPSGWGAVLDGVGAAYIAYFPDLTVPGAPAAVGALARQAAEAGVRRIVLLSGRGEEGAQRAEQEVLAVDAEVTVLRCSWFAQNFTEGAFAQDVESGEVALPVRDVGEPFIDVDDIADAAVVALLEDGHAGEVYELTGPRLLTFEEAIGEIALATGRDLHFRPIPMEEYTTTLRAYGVPEDEIAMLAFLFGEVLDGRNASVADGVRRILGREPRELTAHVRETAA